MSINTNNQDIKIDDELQALAIQKGKKLGLLISELKIDDETRQAFLDLLPSLTLEQIEELTDALELKYLDAATRSEDKKFEEQLIQIKEEYTKKQEEIDKETIKQLEELEKALDQK